MIARTLAIVFLSHATLLAHANDSPRPPENPSPPLKAVTRLKLQPFGPDEYDATYQSHLQQARLEHDPAPERAAMRGVETMRFGQYPSGTSKGQRWRLYQLELNWIDQERRRRDAVSSWRVLQELTAKPGAGDAPTTVD